MGRRLCDAKMYETRQCSGGYETQASTAGLKATILFSWNLRSACTDAQMYEPPTI